MLEMDAKSLICLNIHLITALQLFFWTWCIFRALLPVWGLSRTVSELPLHQPLVALQGELGAHQEASVEVGEAQNLKQRGHRRQGRTLLLRSLKYEENARKGGEQKKVSL